MGSDGPDLPARVENGFGFYLEWSQFPGGKETIYLRNLYWLGNSPFILALTEYSMIKKFFFIQTLVCKQQDMWHLHYCSNRSPEENELQSEC